MPNWQAREQHRKQITKIEKKILQRQGLAEHKSDKMSNEGEKPKKREKGRSTWSTQRNEYENNNK